MKPQGAAERRNIDIGSTGEDWSTQGRISPSTGSALRSVPMVSGNPATKRPTEGCRKGSHYWGSVRDKAAPKATGPLVRPQERPLGRARSRSCCEGIRDPVPAPIEPSKAKSGRRK